MLTGGLEVSFSIETQQNTLSTFNVQGHMNNQIVYKECMYEYIHTLESKQNQDGFIMNLLKY